MTESNAAPESRAGIGKVEFAVLAAFLVAGAAYWYFELRKPERPNIILISIDTLRADHLSCYGYRSKSGQRTSPAMDALAGQGVRFGNAHSTTSWTLPSHLALMTGLPDQLHGVQHDRLRLDPNRKMLAERLTEAGYVCAGFFGGPYLDPFFGFGRGFAQYTNCGAPTVYGNRRESSDPAAIARMEQLSHSSRTAKNTTKSAIEFLESRHDAEDPFFLFVHHWDCHYDYKAPPDFVKRFAPVPRALSMDGYYHNEAIKTGMDPADLEWIIANYDAEIAWVDSQIEVLLNKLEDLHLAENTIVCIVADHGEEFFEHGNKGHRINLNAESLHVPMLFRGPGIRQGATIEETVRLFDVAPTLLDLVGLPAQETYGESLGPLLRTDRVPDALRDLPIVAELTFIPLIPGEDGKLVDPEFYFHHEAWSSLGHKLIEVRKRKFDSQNPYALDGEVIKYYKGQVYKLNDPSDPLEQNNLKKSDPELWNRLRTDSALLKEGLKQYKATLKSEANPKPLEFDEAMLEKLRQQGYIGATPPNIHLEEEDEEEEGSEPEVVKPPGSTSSGK